VRKNKRLEKRGDKKNEGISAINYIKNKKKGGEEITNRGFIHDEKNPDMGSLR